MTSIATFNENNLFVGYRCIEMTVDLGSGYLRFPSQAFDRDCRR